jgi:hypothetical protein
MIPRKQLSDARPIPLHRMELCSRRAVMEIPALEGYLNLILCLF